MFIIPYNRKNMSKKRMPHFVHTGNICIFRIAFHAAFSLFFQYQDNLIFFRICRFFRQTESIWIGCVLFFLRLIFCKYFAENNGRNIRNCSKSQKHPQHTAVHQSGRCKEGYKYKGCRTDNQSQCPGQIQNRNQQSIFESVFDIIFKSCRVGENISQHHQI